jgi:hypothetical protein
MRRLAALCCLAAVLGLLLTWEVVAPDDHGAVEAAAPAASPGRAGERRPAPQAFDAEALADIATSVTRRPLFSPTRRPPSSPAKSVGPAPGRDEVPRLTGVIVGPSGGWAIFAGADGKSHAAATGDAVGAFRVRSIGPGVVTLTGSEGDRVLRPAYVNPSGVTSSEIPTPDVASLPAVRGIRNREGSR